MVDEVSMAKLIPLTSAAGEVRKPDDPTKVRDAAQQFEALLLGQILRSVREAEGSWLGSGSDSAADCATEFAEQHLAAVLASQGGLGLADLIASGLKPRS